MTESNFGTSDLAMGVAAAAWKKIQEELDGLGKIDKRDAIECLVSDLADQSFALDAQIQEIENPAPLPEGAAEVSKPIEEPAAE